ALYAILSDDASDREGKSERASSHASARARSRTHSCAGATWTERDKRLSAEQPSAHCPAAESCPAVRNVAEDGIMPGPRDTRLCVIGSGGIGRATMLVPPGERAHASRADITGAFANGLSGSRGECADDCSPDGHLDDAGR